MFITTPMQTYEQLIMADSDILSSTTDNTIDNFRVFPNPFKTNVNFNFYSETEELTTLRIFNIKGQVVFQSQTMMFSGNNNISWNGKSLQGADLPKGIYFYEIELGSKKEKGKIVLSN